MGSAQPTSCLCNAGFEGVNGGPCAACPAGTWKSTTGDFNCTRCVAGKYSTTIAAVMESMCANCTRFSTSVPGSPAKSNCLCMTGRTHVAGNMDIGTNDKCRQCSFGKYKDTASNDACAWCAANSYTEMESGAETCIKCIRNSNSFVASVRSSSCACNDGYTGPSCLMSKPTPEDMAKPSFRKFDLDINLEIVAIPADVPGETARLLIETANFFGVDPTNITTKDLDQNTEGDEGASSELLGSGSDSSESWDVRRVVTWDSQFVTIEAAAQRQVKSQHKRPSTMNEAASLRQVTSTPLVVQVACVGGYSDLLHICILIAYSLYTYIYTHIYVWIDSDVLHISVLIANSLHLNVFIAYFLVTIGMGLCIFIAYLLHI